MLSGLNFNINSGKPKHLKKIRKNRKSSQKRQKASIALSQSCSSQTSISKPLMMSLVKPAADNSIDAEKELEKLCEDLQAYE